MLTEQQHAAIDEAVKGMRLNSDEYIVGVKRGIEEVITNSEKYGLKPIEE